METRPKRVFLAYNRWQIVLTWLRWSTYQAGTTAEYANETDRKKINVASAKSPLEPSLHISRKDRKHMLANVFF